MIKRCRQNVGGWEAVKIRVIFCSNYLKAVPDCHLTATAVQVAFVLLMVMFPASEGFKSKVNRSGMDTRKLKKDWEGCEKA